MKLLDKVVFVTGGAQGIGQVIALKMAQKGANVCIGDINVQKIQEVVKEIEGLGRKGLGIKIDVSDKDAVTSAFGQIKEVFDRIDVLVNNAGITKDSLILRMKDDDWDAVLNINLKGTFLCSKEAIKVMSKQRSGKIVNIASVVAFMGNAGQANYSASKAGIVGLTKTLAREYASRGITVNAVAPGFIKTHMTDVLTEDVKNNLLKSIPLGTLGAPEDVAEAVLFLSSNSADYITGQVIHVNGGMYM
jgi:3-oxoacyl-[acyl-carrier protein] reductase